MKNIHLSDIAAGGAQAILSVRNGGTVDVDGSLISVQYKPGRGKDMIVLFHGVIAPERQQKSGDKPIFQRFLPIDCPQISVADPTLQMMRDVSGGWYLGGEGENVPEKITRLLQTISQCLGCTRRVYVGGSMGGFAALLYAGLDPGSVAVAACPQTNLATYQNRNVCWFVEQKYPTTRTLPPEADLSNFIPSRWQSSAVILVSSGNYNHLFTQVMPFVTALGFERRKNIVLNVAYHGTLGHSNSIPPAVYMDWVRAVLQCPRFTADDVMQTHHTMQSARIPSQSIPRPTVTASTDASEVSNAAIAFTDILRDHQLRQINET